MPEKRILEEEEESMAHLLKRQRAVALGLEAGVCGKEGGQE